MTASNVNFARKHTFLFFNINDFKQTLAINLLYFWNCFADRSCAVRRNIGLEEPRRKIILVPETSVLP